MKKGDLRKQEILTIAESLFCKNGFEQTSIQDILDQLQSSKGSFYHHFPSKESLLEGICKKRARQIYLLTEEEMQHKDDILAKLNCLFSGMIPLCHEKISFLLMLLPIFRLPEGRSVRQGFCDALREQFMEGVVTYLQTGHQEGLLFCSDCQITSNIILLLLNDLWIRICDSIVSYEEKMEEPDLSELLNWVDEYRLTLEKIITLPFGSISLTDANELRQITGQIHNHWT